MSILHSHYDSCQPLTLYLFKSFRFVCKALYGWMILNNYCKRYESNGLYPIWGTILEFSWEVERATAIPVPNRGGLQGWETLRMPNFLVNQLTDGSEVVSLKHWKLFTLGEIGGTHFCWRLRWPRGHSAAGRTRSIEKSNSVIRNRTLDLPACSIVVYLCKAVPVLNKIKHYAKKAYGEVDVETHIFFASTLAEG
jgi:hypothetical protein